jgi:glucan biosynthesis protein C
MSLPNLESKKRLYYLEIMKALCVFFVFIFHCTRVFDAEDWHIKDPNHTDISYFYLFEFGMAVMPSLFFISGASVWFSMQKRSAGTMLKNVAKRFLFPLIFGCVVLGWIQVYFERVSHGEFEGSIIDFIPYYFEGLHGFGGNFAWHGMHLWYLLVLFIYTILLLPFFIIGKKLLQLPFFQKLTGSLLILVFFTCLIVIPGWKLHFNSLWGRWHLFQNAIYFSLGFVVFSNPLLLEKIKKTKWISLIIAISLTALCFYWHETKPSPAFRSSFYTFRLIVRSVATMAWIVSVLGIASHYFNKENRVSQYITKAILPFYILHQPIVIVMAFYLVQWPIPIPVKLFILLFGCFGLTIAGLEIIKRVSFLRWLLGIPEKQAVKRVNNLLAYVKVLPKNREAKAVDTTSPKG